MDAAGFVVAQDRAVRGIDDADDEPPDGPVSQPDPPLEAGSYSLPRRLPGGGDPLRERERSLLRPEPPYLVVGHRGPKRDELLLQPRLSHRPLYLCQEFLPPGF